MMSTPSWETRLRGSHVTHQRDDLGSVGVELVDPGPRAAESRGEHRYLLFEDHFDLGTNPALAHRGQLRLEGGRVLLPLHIEALGNLAQLLSGLGRNQVATRRRDSSLANRLLEVGGEE